HDTDTSTPYASCLQYSWHSAISSEELTTCFFFNDTPTTEIYTLSLHDALPICLRFDAVFPDTDLRGRQPVAVFHLFVQGHPEGGRGRAGESVPGGLPVPTGAGYPGAGPRPGGRLDHRDVPDHAGPHPLSLDQAGEP